MIEEILTILGVIFLGVNLGIMHTYMQTSEQAKGPTPEFTNLGVPTTINTFLVFFLLYGIYESNKSGNSKLILISLLLLFTGAELYFVYQKPDNKDLRGFYTAIIYLSSLIKLYLLITLHADVSSSTSKNIFSNIKMPKISIPKKVPTDKDRTNPTKIGQPNPRAERVEVPTQLTLDAQKATKIFESMVEKTDLDEDEKADFEERFLNAFEEEQPWQKANDTFSAILNKISEEKLSRDEKQEIRNSFRKAMGKEIKRGGR